MADDKSDGDFSDGLDEFEESADETNFKKKNETMYKDKPYDEAVEFSQDLSVNESFDHRNKQADRAQKLLNDKYDEAVEVSQSMDQGMGMKMEPEEKGSATGGASSRPNITSLPEEKTNSFMNKPFDEALEFSQSNSDESVDTRGGDMARNNNYSSDAKKSPMPAGNLQPQSQAKQMASLQVEESSGSEESDEDEDDVAKQNYDNIDGAYNPKDYSHLNVTAEIRDLFQYIERYNAQPVELDTTLKCFVPDYIPSIGEMDAFIKVPRPDGKEDDLGLKRLDEPTAIQSDPTVLELQLRAMTKKQQYGDVSVRAIENAEKSPLAIEKWINNIKELHRSKPPPQVHYHKNMPEIESLMEVWPESFEAALANIQLPPPDLDLSVAEYAKLLCSILDIPVYENPVESLHLMFTLFTDFRNNPHFQAMRAGTNADADHKEADYGDADVMMIDSDYK